jgi:hypothetical protein
VTDNDWKTLLDRIRGSKCTPFLGAGASWPTLPTGKQIARDWADEHKYPLEDSHDLARVTQYIGVLQDHVVPKEQMAHRLLAAGVPDFSLPSEPHAVLAKLPIPIFMTTNYDDFMTQALRLAGKEPRREFCRWNPAVMDASGGLTDDDAYEPSVDEPLVFHLHGHLELVESLVLTENDYLDFLVAVSSDRELLPDCVKEAFATTLLFVGYSLSDWDFRVLHRGLVKNRPAALRRFSVTVQLPRKDRRKRVAQDYLEKYFRQMEAKVFWGDATEFASQLARRWEGLSTDG